MKIKRWTSVVTFVQDDDTICLRHGSLLSYQRSFLMCGLVSWACYRSIFQNKNSVSVLVQYTCMYLQNCVWGQNIIVPKLIPISLSGGLTKRRKKARHHPCFVENHQTNIHIFINYYKTNWISNLWQIAHITYHVEAQGIHRFIFYNWNLHNIQIACSKTIIWACPHIFAQFISLFQSTS